MASIRTVLLSLAVVAGLAACSTGGVPLSADAPLASAPAYTLGPGDKVRVAVYGEQTINSEYAVGSDGVISFPLIGSIEARGKTVAEFRDIIAKKLAAGYILDPKVSVEVLTYRPFYILGEVNKPGQYPYSSDLSVSQAVATAGGFTYRANTGRIFIRRSNKPAEEAYRLTPTAPVWVLPGDTIRVGERYF